MSENADKHPERFHRKEVQRVMVKNARKAKIIDKIAERICNHMCYFSSYSID